MQTEQWGGGEAYGAFGDGSSDAVAAVGVDRGGEPEGEEGESEFHDGDGEDGGIEWMRFG